MRVTLLIAVVPWLLCGAQTGKQKIPEPPAIEVPATSDPMPKLLPPAPKPVQFHAGCIAPVLIRKLPTPFIQGIPPTHVEVVVQITADGIPFGPYSDPPRSSQMEDQILRNVYGGYIPPYIIFSNVRASGGLPLNGSEIGYINSIQAWKWRPAMCGNTPVSAHVRILVDFPMPSCELTPEIIGYAMKPDATLDVDKAQAMCNAKTLRHRP